MTQLTDGGGGVVGDVTDDPSLGEESDGGLVDSVVDTTTEQLQTQPGVLGGLSFLYQTGSTFEGNEEEVRDAAMDDEDASWWVKATATSSTLVSDPSGDAASDTAEVFTTGAAGDAADAVRDAAEDAVETATDFVPDWLPLAGGAVLAVAVLALLAYAFGQLVTLNKEV